MAEMPLPVTTATAFTEAEVQEAKNVCVSAYAAFKAGGDFLQRLPPTPQIMVTRVPSFGLLLMSAMALACRVTWPLRLHTLWFQTWFVPQVTCTA